MAFISRIRGFLFVLEIFLTMSQAQISFPYGNATYWLPGSLVKLPWEIKFSSSDIFVVQWSFTRSGSTQTKDLAAQFRTSAPRILDQTYSIIDGATLVFQNANLSHNGTYTLAVTLRASAGGNTVRSNVLVIILEQPTAVTNCSQPVAVEEGKDVACSCYGTNGNPPPTALWSKGCEKISKVGYSKETLFLKNVSEENAGTYRCTVRSYNLTDEKAIKVILNSKPTIVFFEINRAENIATFGQKVTIICVAQSTLPLEYIILFNGVKLTGVVSGVKTVHKVNYSEAGRYECLAKNNLGNVSESLYLNVTDDFRNSMTSPTKVISSYSNATEKWYLFIVVSISGVCIGMLFLYAMQRLCHKLKNKNRDSTASGTSAIPGAYPGEAGNISSYQELNLRKIDDREHYQSLRMNSRSPKNNEAKGEDQAGYQELNIVRQNIDNNYQSLNRV